VKKSHIWWCLDLMLNASFQQNPFDHQSNELTIIQLWFILCDDLDFFVRLV